MEHRRAGWYRGVINQNILILLFSPYYQGEEIIRPAPLGFIALVSILLVVPGAATSFSPIPGLAAIPTDPDFDGWYEDINGNGRIDFADVVIYFKNMQWIALNEPVTGFDYNGNGRIDFNDVVVLFREAGQPLPPCVRPPTGYSFIPDTMSGSAFLTIDNQNEYDAVVALRHAAVPPESGTKVLSFYVRAYDGCNVSHIEIGSYTLWYKLGECWDSGNSTFKTGRGAWRFDDIFAYSDDTAGYKVWIYPVEGGNATTTSVPADLI